MTPLILLAAGASTRTVDKIGVPKGLIERHGRPWILNQLHLLTLTPVGRVIVVLGHHKEAFLEALAGAAVETVTNPDPDRGPFSSLQCGLRDESGAAFVLPIDVPVPRREVFEALEETTKVAAIPTFEQRGGHPVLLRQVAIAHLLALDPVTNRLDHQLRELDADRIAVEDPTILENHNEA